MGPVDYFDIFKGANNQYYWNLHNGGNHAIIATSGEGFEQKQWAYRSARNFQNTVQTAYVPTEEDASMATDDIIGDVEDEEPPELEDADSLHEVLHPEGEDHDD